MNKIIFMGTPDFAVPTLKAIYNSKHEICMVITNPDKPFGRGRKLRSSAIKIEAEHLNYPILQPEKLNDPLFLDQIKNLNPSLIVVVAFKKLPSKFFNPELLQVVHLPSFNPFII